MAGDKAIELFLGGINPIPESDEYNFELEGRIARAQYLYAKEDIFDNLGEEEFKDLYMIGMEIIRNKTIKVQRKFSEQILDKISEVYDFEFPVKLELNTKYQLEEFYKFIEFLEFNSERFLSYVWKFLDENIMKLDIDSYCITNADKIISEIEEQLESHPQNEIITIFLRTYSKDKIIEWFSRMSKRFKIFIAIENLEGKD
jgi:hypothetical protein